MLTHSILYFRCLFIPFFTLLFLTLGSVLFFPMTAIAVNITFKAVNQHGKHVKGAHITVKGYGTAIAGKSVHIKSGKTIFYSASISGIEGRFISKKITKRTRDVVYPFTQVQFSARDQNGKEVPGSSVYVGGYKPVKSGNMLDLPDGVVISLSGRIFGLEGRYIYKKISREKEEIVYPFVAVPFYAKDERGRTLPKGSGYIDGYGNVKSGAIVSLPEGLRINYKGKMAKVYGVTYSKSIDSNVKEIVFPFKSVGFVAKDQHGRRLKKVNLHVTGIGSVQSGTRIYLPKGAKISYKVDLLSDPGSSIEEKYVEVESGKRYKIRYQKNALSSYIEEKVTKNFSEALIPVEVDYGIPVADAGSEKVVSRGRTIFLDGSGSYSQAQNPLIYTWKQISGPAVEVTDLSMPKLEVNLPDDVQSNETLIFALVVTDGSVHSQPDTINVKLDALNIVVAKKGDDWAIDF